MAINTYKKLALLPFLQITSCVLCFFFLANDTWPCAIIEKSLKFSCSELKQYLHIKLAYFWTLTCCNFESDILSLKYLCYVDKLIRKHIKVREHFTIDKDKQHFLNMHVLCGYISPVFAGPFTALCIHELTYQISSV